jgi:hypothetical protein
MTTRREFLKASALSVGAVVLSHSAVQAEAEELPLFDQLTYVNYELQQDVEEFYKELNFQPVYQLTEEELREQDLAFSARLDANLPENLIIAKHFQTFIFFEGVKRQNLEGSGLLLGNSRTDSIRKYAEKYRNWQRLPKGRLYKIEHLSIVPMPPTDIKTVLANCHDEEYHYNDIVCRLVYGKSMKQMGFSAEDMFNLKLGRET